MSKLDDILYIKMELKDLMLELIGPDYTKTSYGAAPELTALANAEKAKLRQKVMEL